MLAVAQWGEHRNLSAIGVRIPSVQPMKIKLTADESYRVFICRDESDWGTEVEVPEELIQRFEKADEAFRKVEEQLHRLLTEAEDKIYASQSAQVAAKLRQSGSASAEH